MGTSTEKVIRHSSAPILTIKKAVPVNKIENILLPIASSEADPAFTQKLKELQVFFGAKLHLLLINTPLGFRRNKEARQLLEEFTEHHKLENYTTHFKSYFSVTEGILDFSINKPIDMIAMSTHARKGVALLYNGSVAEDIVNTTSLPTWVHHVDKPGPAYNKSRRGE